jgi:hypothetical protein
LKFQTENKFEAFYINFYPSLNFSFFIDSVYLHQSEEMDISSLNVSRIMRSVGELFNTGLILTDEEDKWFEKTFQHLDDVERIIYQIQHDVTDLSTSRKEQAKGSIELNRALSALALCEENNMLSLTLDNLAVLHASSSSMQNYDAEMDYLLVRSFVDQIQRIRVSL